jgi:hypothetical protein
MSSATNPPPGQQPLGGASQFHQNNGMREYLGRTWSLLQRWLSKLRSPPPPDRQYVRPFEAVLPCLGDAFHFTAEVHCVWSASLPVQETRQRIKELEPTYHLFLQSELRKISRQYPTESCDEAERHINDEAQRKWQSYAEWDPKLGNYLDTGHNRARRTSGLKCRVWVHLYSDEFMRAHNRNVWKARSTQEANHELAKQRILQIHELQVLWSKFFEQHPMQERRALYALGLAVDPKNLLEVSRDMLRTHEDEVQQLQEMCNDAVAAHERLDLYDFVTSYDSSLCNLMRYLGISASAPASSSPDGGTGSKEGE